MHKLVSFSNHRPEIAVILKVINFQQKGGGLVFYCAAPSGSPHSKLICRAAFKLKMIGLHIGGKKVLG